MGERENMREEGKERENSFGSIISFEIAYFRHSYIPTTKCNCTYAVEASTVDLSVFYRLYNATVTALLLRT